MEEAGNRQAVSQDCGSVEEAGNRQAVSLFPGGVRCSVLCKSIHCLCHQNGTEWMGSTTTGWYQSGLSTLACHKVDVEGLVELV